MMCRYPIAFMVTEKKPQTVTEEGCFTVMMGDLGSYLSDPGPL